jgi:hypothetical protein
MLRVRARAEGPRRAADGGRPSSAPGGGEAAQPLGVHADPGRAPRRCAAGAWLSWLGRLEPQHHAVWGPSRRGQPRTCSGQAQVLQNRAHLSSLHDGTKTLIQMAVDAYHTGNPSLWIALVRLPFQIPLIWWAWNAPCAAASRLAASFQSPLASCSVAASSRCRSASYYANNGQIFELTRPSRLYAEMTGRASGPTRALASPNQAINGAAAPPMPCRRHGR